METNDFSKYRNEIPVCRKHCYLDNAGIAPLSTRIKKAIDVYLEDQISHGAFSLLKWHKQIEDVRRICASLINADMDEVAFVRSTSHGISLVAHGLAWKEGDSVILPENEFPSNLFPWIELKKKGVDVKTIRTKEARIDEQDIRNLIDNRTKVLAISAVQFNDGFKIDLSKIGEICAERNIFLCVDAIQALGVIPIDVKEMNIDFLSADAHKWLMGPEGIGIFYCKKSLAEQLQPALIGWKSVKNAFNFEKPEYLLKTNAGRFEEGSMNHIGIIGLGEALRLLEEIGIKRIEQHVLGLGSLIMENALRRGFNVITPRKESERAGITTFNGVFDPMKVRSALYDREIMVNVRAGGLRVSPHFYNNEEDVAMLFKAMDEICFQ